MDGRVNTGARSIHVVKSDQPKMLRGLSHKGTVAGDRDCPLPCHGHAMLPGEERAPHPSVSTVWNVGSPYRSFRKEGRKVVRPTDSHAGMGVGKSERRPVMGRIRVAPVVLATSRDAKAGRLPCGVSVRETRRNRYRRCCKCRWLCPLVLPSPQGNRLLSSIVQPAGCMTADGSFTRPLRCLSRMKGNFHVRF